MIKNSQFGEKCAVRPLIIVIKYISDFWSEEVLFGELDYLFVSLFEVAEQHLVVNFISGHWKGYDVLYQVLLHFEIVLFWKLLDDSLHSAECDKWIAWGRLFFDLILQKSSISAD